MERLWAFPASICGGRPATTPTRSRRSPHDRTHFLPYPPDLHALEGDRRFYRNRVFSDCRVCAAEEDGILVGFCAYRTGWIDHLYILPAHVGRKLGTALLAEAIEGQHALRLWVFQRNTRAVGFYEHHGFSKLKETDGSAFEEKLPDALYAWRRPP